MPCPVCTCVVTPVLFAVAVSRHGNTDATFDVKQCSACGFAYVRPLPDEALLGSFYEGDYHKEKENILNEVLCRLNRATVIRSLKKMRPYGKVLDVGCGRGAFLKAMQEAGYQAYGIEPSRTGHSISSLMDRITVLNEPVEQCRLPSENFDIVTLWHSLEHMGEPDNVLKKIRQLIKSEGVLVIEVPNFSSWEARIFRKSWCHLDIPRRLSFYSKKSLGQLLKNHGFKILTFSPESFLSAPLSVLKSAIAGVRNSRGLAQLFAAMLLPAALVLSLVRIVPLLGIRTFLRVYAVPAKENVP